MRRRRSKGNVPAQKFRARLRKFGLTEHQYRALHESQLGRCAICLRPSPSRRLAVDHCHASGAVRGLLCTSCNLGLGHFGDKDGLLIRAAQYLNRSTRFGGATP